MTSAVDPTRRNALILIVDDEPFNADYLEQELESHGYATHTAANGLEALEQVAADPPDLVLLDVMMPELDGITALRILKSDPETRLIPVVLMTALNAVDDRVRGIEAGADDFLSKPVDDRELLARIRTALVQKRVVDETVDELRTTSEHLQRYGRNEREVAVLAVAWHLGDATVPGAAASFVARTWKRRAEERIAALGGTRSENPGSQLVAVFEGPDPRTRAVAAVEAALAVLDEGTSAATVAAVTVAVSAGPTCIGSRRISEADAPRWLYAATGPAVDRASDLAASGDPAGLVVTGEIAAAVNARYALEPTGEGAYIVVGRTALDQDGSTSSTGDRRIRTLLVTDVAGSTRTVERVGDRAWSRLVAAHDTVIRDELLLFDGEEIDAAGDGFLAAFDRPTSAVRCALAAVERIEALGLSIRVGIHTGEVERDGPRLRGIAVHIANRIADSAQPGEVLVSGTTRELTAGAGLAFVDRGDHALKGVSEPRRLYSADAAVTPAADAPVAPVPPTAESPNGANEYPAGLTAREVDVLRLVAIGLSDAEAASRLFVSVRTVNAHLRSVYRKIGVRSRAAAGRFAAEHGLL